VYAFFEKKNNDLPDYTSVSSFSHHRYCQSIWNQFDVAGEP